MSTAEPRGGGGHHRSTPRPRARLAVAVLLASTLTTVLGGCAGSTRQERLTVLVASSLVDVTADLAAGWGELPVDVIDAGTQVLAAQVRAGAPADLLLLADPDIATALADEGLAGPATVVAGNALALVTPAGRPLDGPADLADPALRVVLADEAVPLGAATRRALADDPAVDADAVLAGVDSLEDAARLVLAKVTSGDADAAVVYRTDALAAGDAVTVVAWPVGAATTTSVTAQAVDDGAGASLLAYLTSDAARATWAAAGFAPPAA